MADPSSVDPADCPEPFWHETHRYCPCCSWTEPVQAITQEQANELLQRLEAKGVTPEHVAEYLRVRRG